MRRGRVLVLIIMMASVGAWSPSAATSVDANPPEGYRDGPEGVAAPSDPPEQTAPGTAAEGPEAPATALAAPGVYSPPEWLPVRATADVGCVFTNCDLESGPYHNYWAVDLLDPANQPGDPIHAAGAGQASIVNRGSTCGGPGTPGNGVEVDHGGGVVTWYFHLHEITVADGQWVDPTTQLGTMGATGHTFPCPTNHLHFEKKVNGTRVDPGPLKACHGTTLVQYPQAAGYSSWDDIPFGSRSVHSDGTSCGSAPTTVTGFTWYSDGSRERSGATGTAITAYATGLAAGKRYRLVSGRPDPAKPDAPCASDVSPVNATVRVSSVSGFIANTTGTVDRPVGEWQICFKQTDGPAVGAALTFRVR